MSEVINFRCESTEESKRFWGSVDKAASKAPKEVIVKINESYKRNIEKIETDSYK